MGWSYGIRNGREVGYSVEAKCDAIDCGEDIDRGVSYMCGGPAFNDSGCEGFFCEKHLHSIDPVDDEHVTHLCRSCFKAYVDQYTARSVTCPNCGHRGTVADFGISGEGETLSDYGECPGCEEEVQLKSLVNREG